MISTTRLLLFLALLVNGAAIMVIEIAGTRLIHPFFGVTLYVWAALIAITLGSLALGYGLGGWLADRFPKAALLFAIVLAGGLLSLWIPLAASPVMRTLADLDLRLGILITSLLLFSLPLTVMGMVAPFVIKLWLANLQETGRVSGYLYAISTVGSLAGTLATGFWLIPSFPVTNIFWGVAGLLILLALAGLISARAVKAGIAGLILSILVFFLIFISGLSPAKGGMDLANGSPATGGKTQTLYATQSFYGQIKVVERGNLRALLINGSPQNYLVSGQDPYDFFQEFGYDSLIGALPMLKPDMREVLMIGLGIGRIPSYFSRLGIRSDIVEIDPLVAQVAARHFDFKAGDNRLFYGDGRRYLRQWQTQAKRYDSVIIDAFAVYELPDHFFTEEMLREIRGVLAETGIVAINTGGILTGPAARVPQSIYKTMQAVFPHVHAYEVNARDRVNNVVFFASMQPLVWESEICRVLPCEKQKEWIAQFETHAADADLQVGGQILTDNDNPLSVWGVPIYETYRNRVLQYFGKEVLSE